MRNPRTIITFGTKTDNIKNLFEIIIIDRDYYFFYYIYVFDYIIQYIIYLNYRYLK